MKQVDVAGVDLCSAESFHCDQTKDGGGEVERDLRLRWIEGVGGFDRLVERSCENGKSVQPFGSHLMNGFFVPAFSE